MDRHVSEKGLFDDRRSGKRALTLDEPETALAQKDRGQAHSCEAN
ncbi:MAG: hypothetical protein OXN84_04295 [Albidovulum sp.]|nr:hypothetical protein [Albidovulum sp.]